MEKIDLIATRGFHPDDKNFILATWLRGLYYGDTWFGAIPKTIFMKHYHEILDLLIDAPGVSVKVACLKESPDVILGYSVYRGDSLHWVFVKKAWRGIGIAKSLVPTDTKVVTHLTKVGQSILKSCPQVIFNPFDL